MYRKIYREHRKYVIYSYYYMTGRALCGEILFEAGNIGLNEGRGDTEAENGILHEITHPISH